LKLGQKCCWNNGGAWHISAWIHAPPLLDGHEPEDPILLFPLLISTLKVRQHNFWGKRSTWLKVSVFFSSLLLLLLAVTHRYLQKTRNSHKQLTLINFFLFFRSYKKWESEGIDLVLLVPVVVHSRASL
jgi:hypothetical protein